MTRSLRPSERTSVTGSINWAPDASRLADASSPEAAIEAYRAMRRIRSFEETARALFLRGQILGSVHLCVGQEAVSVGVCGALDERDRVAATYRGHGHALALGVDPVALLGEMLGRANGVCGGRAGSMNVIDLEHRLIGCFGIVGGSIGAATGAALALQHEGGVAVAFFGDGAANQAYFAECLNFAKVRSLPVLFVCENNQYGEFTPYQDVTAGSIVGRAKAMEIPAVQIDGNDVWTVRETAARLLAAARSGSGPQFIEAMTYRFVDHGRGDPVDYRPEGEFDAWMKRDPLQQVRLRLAELDDRSAETLDAVDDAVAAEMDEIRALAAEAPLPSVGSGPGEFKEAG
jgi:TPP-dependent pyruvate/acetoin dehydrogenase alpha subunit